MELSARARAIPAIIAPAGSRRFCWRRTSRRRTQHRRAFRARAIETRDCRAGKPWPQRCSSRSRSPTIIRGRTRVHKRLTGNGLKALWWWVGFARCAGSSCRWRWRRCCQRAQLLLRSVPNGASPWQPCSCWGRFSMRTALARTGSHRELALEGAAAEQTSKASRPGSNFGGIERTDAWPYSG